MAAFWAELKRRGVIRAGITYVIVAWVIAQVAALVADSYLAPAWVMQMIIALLVVGLPISLILAWVFDLTRDGIIRTEDDDAEAQWTASNKHASFLIAGVVVVVAATLYMTWPPEEDVSIAVLPFADMSPAGDHAYFGNGIADQLRLELQRLDGLRVAGQTSSNYFRQNDVDPQSFGESINVDWILQGSIRKDEDRIRITAQLVNVADGFTIWSKPYDRDLTSIFAIQEEIATRVAGALGVTLGVGGINAFKGAGTQNVEAYELYLQGRSTSRRAGIPILQRAIELDPEYAAPYAMISLKIIASNWIESPDAAAALLDEALLFALKAVELDPESAEANSKLAILHQVGLDWIRGEQGHAKAMALLRDEWIISQYGNMLMRAGRSAAARVKNDEANSYLPPGETWFQTRVSLAQENFAEIREIETKRGVSPTLALEIALNESDPEGIKAAIRALPKTNLSTIVLYAPVLREFDSPNMVLDILLAVYEDPDNRWPTMYHDIGLLAAYFGDAEFALHVLEKEMRHTPVRFGSLWYPIMSEVRQLPAFKEFVTDVNLVALGRAYGWADACHPLGAEDFECL